MKRLQRLRALNRYLRDFSIANRQGTVKFSYVTSQSDATSYLNKADGYQVLLARPELHQSGDDDGYRDTLDTVIFVLAPDLGAGKTQEKDNALFDTLEGIAEDILQKIDDDITFGSCSLLPGLSLEDVIVVPEIQIFGSWCGFSLEMTFR